MKKAVTKSLAKLLDKLAVFVAECEESYGLRIVYNNQVQMRHVKKLRKKLYALKKSEGIVFVHGPGKRKSPLQKSIETLEGYLDKLKEYTKKIHNCGNRNSYSKTDNDATFMRMKEDAMGNGQLNAGRRWLCVKIYFCNRQKTQFYLLLMPGDKPFKTKDLSKQIGSARLSFGEAVFMEEYLDIFPGAVSVLGLMNDKEHHVQLLIDRPVIESDTIGCHPCVNTSSLKLKTADVLKKFLPAVGHEAIIVELPWEE